MTENDKAPIILPLEELYIYKIQLLSKQLDEAKQAIINPLKQAYEKALEVQINSALKEDKVCKAAHNKHVACINEVLDKVSSALPEGYAVSTISPERGEIIAEFNPDRVGKRLTPESE